MGCEGNNCAPHPTGKGGLRGPCGNIAAYSAMSSDFGLDLEVIHEKRQREWASAG